MTRSPAARWEGRRDLVGLAAGAALLYLLFLGARDLWNPNEPIYGRAVVEMAERGEWLIPRVNDEVFGEKPILYFALARVAGVLTGGVDEFSLRLPSAVAGIVGILLVYLLVQPYGGRLRARIAAVLFGSTYIVFWSARSVQMDLLLTVCSLAAILAVARVLDHEADPGRGYALAGAATGLAFLCKGPVGLIVPAIPLLAHAAFTGRVRELLQPARLLAATATLLPVAAPWLVYLWASGQSEFLVELLYRQNLVRSVEAWDHQAPWWYFLREFWNDMAPWSFFVPLALGLRGRDADQRRLDGLALGWIAGVILFFSIPLSKRSPYILPVAPAVAVLVSGSAERLFLGTLGRLRRRAGLLLIGLYGVLFALAGAWVLREGSRHYPFLGSAAPAAGLLLGGGGLAILAALAHRRRDTAAPVALAGFVYGFYLLVSGWVLPAIDTIKSPRAFCERVGSTVGADDPLYSYGMWRWRAGYVYYTGRTIPRLETPEELAEYWRGPSPAFLIVEDGKRDEVLRVIGREQAVALLSADVGSNTVYLYSNARF